MASLDLDSIDVSSFTTTTVVQPIGHSDNCVSPLCMTEDKACTTPWCKDDAQPALPAGD
jgi:hypothetical protein